MFSLRPAVESLVFQLYGRPLHPELFQFVAERTVTREDYELIVRITPTGHVISWRNANLFLTEVTADADQDLPENRRLIHHRLRQEQNRTMDCDHGIHYQASFHAELLPTEIFQHVHEEILADGSKRGLLHHFPPRDRLALAPLGFVQADARDGCLCLSTFHTFPDENTVVKTQSLIERR